MLYAKIEFIPNLKKEFGSIKEIKIPFDKKTGKNKRICSI
jgi:hypothetical protein